MEMLKQSHPSPQAPKRTVFRTRSDRVTNDTDRSRNESATTPQIAAAKPDSVEEAGSSAVA